jgi:basic amino acid/polyamine antiporter, APA family
MTDTRGETAALSSSGELVRSLGFWGLCAVILNGMVGAGVFALPGSVAHYAGSWVPLVVFGVGLALLPVVIVLARLAGLFEETGGPLLYVKAGLGPFAGYQVGWLQCLSGASSVAANVNLLADYALRAVPQQAGPAAHAGVVLAALAVIFWINLLETRRSAVWIKRISVAKLLPLALLIGLALPVIGGGPAFRPATEWSLSQAVMLSIYAFIGFEGALCIAGEAVDPRRDFPRALVGVFIAVVALYALLAWGYVVAAYVPGGEDKASLLTMAVALMGPSGMPVILMTAVVSIIGITIVSTLFVSRRILALQQTGSLPDWFGVIRHDTGLPRNAVFVAVGVITLLSMSGGFTALAALSVASRLLIYLGCIASLPVVLVRRGQPVSGFVIAMTVLAAVGCLILIGQVALSAWTGLALAMVLGLAVRWTALRSIGGAALAAR